MPKRKPEKCDKSPKVPAQSKKLKPSFTAADFKLLLNDSSKTFTALEEFIQTAKDYPEKTDHDIINAYCGNSNNGQEILQLLEGEKMKSGELTLVFTALEMILNGITEFHTKYEALAKNIVNTILTMHLGKINLLFSMSNKSHHIKSSLKLLRAMVMVNEYCAGNVLCQFNFMDSRIVPLLNRRDIADPQDVRTCLIHFIISFLLVDDNTIITNLMEEKTSDGNGVLSGIFFGLYSDKCTTIELILVTVLDKILLNPSISKIQKARVFEHRAMKQLALLYNWKKPQTWKGKKSGPKMGDDSLEDLNEEQLENRKTVLETVHSFMLQLCSLKNGIVFQDKTYGTSESNRNHLMTITLTALSQVQDNELTEELIVTILKACPDQIHRYLLFIHSSLAPRASDKWLKTMQLLEKIYCTQPVVPPVLTAEEKFSSSQIVEILLVYFVPPSETLLALLGEVKHEVTEVRYVILRFLAVILQRMLQLLQYLKSNPSHRSITEKEDSGMDVGQLIRAAALKSIPDVQMIMFSWDRLFSEKWKSKTDGATLNLTEKLNSSRTDEESVKAEKYNGAILVLRVLCLYRELSPSLTDSPSNLLNLILGIEKLNIDSRTEDEDAETTSHQSSLPELYLLKLLSVADSRKLMWTKESDERHSILYMVLRMYTAQTDKRLVHIMEELLCRLLTSTGLFDKHDETVVWFQQLLDVDKENQDDVILFISKVFRSYIRYPYPHTDRVLELCGSAESMIIAETDAVELSNGKEVEIEHDSFNLGYGNGDSLDEKSPDRKIDAFRLPFCPVIDAAMNMMDKVSEGVCEYMTKVLIKQFHLQVNPVPFCLLLDRYKDVGIKDILKTYISSFRASKKTKAEKLTEIKIYMSPLSSMLLDFHISQKRMDGNDFFVNFKKFMDKSVDENICYIVRQALLYLTTRIDRAAKNFPAKKDSSPQFNVWFEILKLIISKLLRDIEISESKSQNSEEDESTITTYEKEIKMFDVKSETPLTYLSDIVTDIFKHPILIQYFLWNSNLVDDDMIEHISVISNSITVEVSELLHLLSSCFDRTGIGKTVIPIYLRKVVKSIDCVHPSLRRNVSTACVGVLKSCRKFITQSAYLKIINLLLNMKSESFVLKHSAGLSEIGLFVMEVLQQLLDAEKQDLRNFSLQKIEKVFNCIQHVKKGSDKLIQLCIDLLNAHPQFSLAVSGDLLHCLLERPDPDCVQLAKQIVIFNSNLMDVMKVWLMNNKMMLVDVRYTGLIHVCLTVEQEFSTAVDEKFIQRVWKHYRQIFDNLIDASELASNYFSTSESEKNTCGIFYKFLQMGAVDDGYLTKFWSAMTAKIVSTKAASTHLIHLLSKIKLKIQDHHDTELQQQINKFNVILMKCVILSAKDIPSSDFIDCLLDNLSSFNKAKHDQECIRDIRKEWNQFVKCILKTFYKDHRTHRIICDLIPDVYNISDDDADSQLLSLSVLYEMAISHSGFLPVMLEMGDSQLIESITDLLLCVASRTSEPLQSAHLAILLGSYGATLTSKDQKLLKLIYVYESSGIDLAEYRPYLWGRKAVVHHSAKKSLGASLWKHATVEQVLDNFDQITLQRSVDNFPVRRKLSPEEMYVSRDHQSLSDCYDPCFVLPLFSHLLSPESVVNCRNFIDKNGLSYVFTALSSHEVNARKAAFHILSRFYQHLEGARFQEHKQCMYLMSVVKNSVEKSLFKIPCIITLILSRICKLMIKPDNHMYPVINKFLLNNPDIELYSLPLFYQLFNSSTHQNIQERGWILSLLADGLTETADYKILEKRKVFKLLLSFYNSGLSDVQTQLQTLKILKAACNIRSVLLQLIKLHGLFTWITGIINTLDNNREKIELVADLLQSIWLTLTDESVSDKGILFQPTTITRQILLCLQNLLTKSVNARLGTLKTIITTLDMVLEHRKSSSKHLEDTKEIKTATEVFGMSDVSILLLQVSTHEGDLKDREQFIRLLQAQGYIHDTQIFSVDSQSGLEKTSPHCVRTDMTSRQSRPPDGDVNPQLDSLDEEASKLVSDLTKCVISCCCHWNPRVSEIDSHDTRNELVATGYILTASWIIRHLHQCGIDLILKFSYWFDNFINSIPLSNQCVHMHIMNCCHKVGLFCELVELSSFVQSLVMNSSSSDECHINSVLNVLNGTIFTLGKCMNDHSDELEWKNLFSKLFTILEKQKTLSPSSSNHVLSSRSIALILMEFFHNGQNPRNTQEIMDRYGLVIPVKKSSPKKSLKNK